MQELKCVICGKPAKYESMSMASPVCEECAEKMVSMLNKNESIEDLIEEVYVPISGDLTEIRNNK